MRTLPVFEDPKTKEMIGQLSQKHKVPVPLLKDLCDVIQSHSGAARKDLIRSEIAGCIDRFKHHSEK